MYLSAITSGDEARLARAGGAVVSQVDPMEELSQFVTAAIAPFDEASVLRAKEMLRARIPASAPRAGMDQKTILMIGGAGLAAVLLLSMSNRRS